MSYRVSDFRIADWLPPGVRVEDVIVAAAGLAVLVTALAIWSAMTTDDSFDRRFAQIAQGKEALRDQALATKPRNRPSPVGLMRALVTRLNLARSQQAEGARAMMVQAGIRSPDAMVAYLFAQMSLPIVFGAIAAINGYVMHIVPVPVKFANLAIVGAVAAGFYAPRTYLQNIAARRAQRLELGLPDGLDLLVICAEAGLSLDAGLNRVSRELSSTWPELSEELSITAAELTFLPDRNQAFDNLNNRTNLDSIRGVVNTLQQTLKFGTPLARSLRVLAGEFRQQRMTKAEAKAARLPALLTVPMIIFILPTLFIVMLGPAILGVIDVLNGHSHQSATASVSTKADGAAGAAASGATPTAGAAAGAADGGGDAASDAAADAEPDATAAPGSPPAAAARAAGPASVAPTADAVRFVDPIVVDVDARALRNGSDQRLAVVPAGTPDAIADATAFARTSTGLLPIKKRAFLIPAAPGTNEVRLYDIPPGQSKYAVAARARVEVGSALPGAVNAAALARDAGVLGPEAFAAAYRGRTVAIEGQFLGVQSYAAGSLAAAAELRPVLDPRTPYTALILAWSQRPATGSDGPPSAVVCLIAAGDPGMLARAGLQPGAATVVRGRPIATAAVAGVMAAVVSPCTLSR